MHLGRVRCLQLHQGGLHHAAQPASAVYFRALPLPTLAQVLADLRKQQREAADSRELAEGREERLKAEVAHLHEVGQRGVQQAGGACGSGGVGGLETGRGARWFACCVDQSWFLVARRLLALPMIESSRQPPHSRSPPAAAAGRLACRTAARTGGQAGQRDGVRDQVPTHGEGWVGGGSAG